MTKIQKLLLLFFVSFNSFSQNSEFKVYENGLIYSDFTVKKLKKCVDSLELKYKSCQPQDFYSLKQSTANYVLLKKSKVKEAKKDIDAGISFEDFKKKYPKAEVVEKLPVAYFLARDYDNSKEKSIDISSIEIGEYDAHTINISLEKFKEKLGGKWVYEYSKKESYSSEFISAFYLIENFSSKKIDEKYAKLIQYSECLTDTTSNVFYDEAKDDRNYNESSSDVFKFNEYVENVLKRPSIEDRKYEILFGFDEDFNEKKRNKNEQEERDKLKTKIEAEFKIFEDKMKDWESKRLMRIDSLKNTDANFTVMLNKGYEDALKKSNSNDGFEELVGIYISKEAALELKRRRRVVGGCSMDMSPRIHAKNIAILSAETAKWEVFLKAHLNIMNDRFDRISDGSYAYGARNSYIKELEVLDIDVLNLILGTVLRIDNPTKNHYYASISRIGRALSESKDRKTLESRMSEFIEDNNLDDFNRIMMYYLFLNYNSYLENGVEKKENIEKLKNSVAKMPDYISNKIQFK